MGSAAIIWATLSVTSWMAHHATFDAGDEVGACFCVGVAKSPEMKSRKRPMSVCADTGRIAVIRALLGFVA